MINQAKNEGDYLPECPECDENEHIQSLGIVEYGADYSDGEWYEKCQFLPEYYCLKCGCQFVIDDDD